MKHIQGIDVEGRRARAAEGGSYLGTDVATLAHSGENHLALAAQNQLHNGIKVFIEQGHKAKHGFSLVLQAFDCDFSILTHICSE